jgi:hypothetical protein
MHIEHERVGAMHRTRLAVPVGPHVFLAAALTLSLSAIGCSSSTDTEPNPAGGTGGTTSTGATGGGGTSSGGNAGTGGTTTGTGSGGNGTPGAPYEHVVPSDVGNTIGVGVTAPVPTAPYTGPNPVTTSNTTIENVVIDGCLLIGHDASVVHNVTVRNVIVNCDSYFGVWILDASDVTVVNSQIANATSSADKAVFIEANATSIHFEKNDISGGQDFFFFGDNIDEVYIEDNYMHDPTGDAASHSDGFQWWPDVGSGAFYIRGNHLTRGNSLATPNDILFSGDEQSTVVFENNYLGLWGWYTLRWHGEGSNLTARYNVYEQAFKTAFQTSELPSHALYFDPEDGLGGSTYRCNRYEDGSFIEQQYILAGGGPAPTHDITNCPSYPR